MNRPVAVDMMEGFSWSSFIIVFWVF